MQLEQASLRAVDSLEAHGDWLLIVSIVGCQACDMMRDAIEQSDDCRLPEKAFIIKIDDMNAEFDALEAIEVDQFPTLIHYRNKDEIKRWAGFFDDPDPMVRLEKMTELLADHLIGLPNSQSAERT